MRVVIYLTEVTTTCSVLAHGGLSAKYERVRDAVCQRAGMPGLPVPAALARGISLPELRR